MADDGDHSTTVLAVGLTFLFVCVAIVATRTCCLVRRWHKMDKVEAAGKAKTVGKAKAAGKGKATGKAKATGKTKTTGKTKAAGKAKAAAKGKTTAKAKTHAKGDNAGTSTTGQVDGGPHYYDNPGHLEMPDHQGGGGKDCNGGD